MTDGRQTSRLSGADLRALYRAKAAVSAAIFVALWMLIGLVSPGTSAIPIAMVVMLSLVPTLVIAAQAQVPGWILTAGFGADIIAITAAIHLNTGVDQASGPLLYTAVVGLVGFVLSERAAVTAAAASAAAYALLVRAEYTGLLTHGMGAARPPEQQAAIVVMVSLYLLLVASLVSYVGRQLRASHRRAEALRAESASALSHDLKNPLAIIHGYAEMIQEAEGDEHRDFARRIQRSVQQALDLVRNVIDVSAMDAKPITPERVSLDLNELASQACEYYRPAADAKGVRLSTVFAMGLPTVEADPQLVTRAIGNLVSNAVKYTEQGGSVELGTNMNGDSVTITVSDSGVGIPDTEISGLFEKHIRPATGRTNEGTGLGLYLVRRIAEAHGGSITVASAVGRGSTFTLTLPTRARGGYV
jgi:signal transduction histidine kinase